MTEHAVDPGYPEPSTSNQFDHPLFDDAEPVMEPNMAIFTVELVAVDHPTERRRWDGGPMPSEDANAALRSAVEAFEAAIRAAGFVIARTGYGVRVKRPDVAAQVRAGRWDN